jgi:hypothetical protein
MLRRLLATTVLCSALCGVAAAQPVGLFVGGGRGSSYVGPGNQVAFTEWWSCSRAYNTADATAMNNTCTLRRASDNTTSTFKVLSNGNFDVASANTFAGADATASCTISTTTATCTGASSTPHVGSTITGTGLTQPCYATAIGTFTSGAGTVTLAGIGSTPCGTVSVAETLTFQYALFVTSAAEKSGNGNAATQATTTAQPQWQPSVINGKPCLHYNGSQFLNATAITFGAQPISASWVSNRTPTSSGVMSVLSVLSAGAVDWGHFATNDAWEYAGTSVQETASDGSFHTISGVINGASSAMQVDGTLTTGLSAGSNSPIGSNVVSWGDDAASQFFIGYSCEGGVINTTALNSTQMGNLRTSGSGFYGTP